MPEHREKKHIFTHNNGAVVEVHTDWTHSTLHPLTFATVEIKLHDYSGGNEITLWHNGERWIVRYDERALGDHNNFECVDQWQLRSREEAEKQFVDGFDDIPVVDV